MRTAVAVALVALGCAQQPVPTPAPAAPAIATAEQLVGAMHDRYTGKWYSTLTFVQKNTRYLPDGRTDTSTWSEALSFPGKLRIDVEPRANGNGNIYRNDTVYVFSNGRLLREAYAPHPLLLLGFDVYFIPVERTIATLRQLGFDLSRMHESTWQGRPAYVVGAAPGDTRARQFWVDRDRLVFVRMLEPSRRDTTTTAEIRFSTYYEVDGGWLAPEVEFLIDGQRDFLEVYTEIKTGIPVAESVFDPKKWRQR
ncbi:MAG: hypothetical protein ACT4PJ_15300 [Gemmatimonadaceae bacterium]